MFYTGDVHMYSFSKYKILSSTLFIGSLIITLSSPYTVDFIIDRGIHFRVLLADRVDNRYISLDHQYLTLAWPLYDSLTRDILRRVYLQWQQKCCLDSKGRHGALVSWFSCQAWVWIPSSPRGFIEQLKIYPHCLVLVYFSNICLPFSSFNHNAYTYIHTSSLLD